MAAADLALHAPAAPRTAGGGLAYKWLVLIAMLPGMTVFLIDVTVVNVALAKLGAVFSVDVATVQWVITAYSLASGISTPLASFLERRFTMKVVWVFALSVFTGASVLCGLAPAFWVLILGRALQGFVGGLLLPLAISTLFQTFPPQERGQALGFFAIPIVAGPALGPTLGGYIVTNWDWRLVFFINLPIGVAAIILSIICLRPGVRHFDARFDGMGFVLSSAAFGLILYGLSQVSTDGWNSFTVEALIGTGLFALVCFIGWELTRSDPLLNMRLFAIPQFLNSNIVGWVSTVALFGAEFMLPLYLQNLRGLSAVDTGLLLMPQGLAAAVSGPVAGRLVDRIGARWIVMFGFALLAFNTYQLSQLTLTTPYQQLIGLLVVRGLSLGCTLQPTQLTALAAVPPRYRTNASSVSTALRNTVQAFGIAMLSTIVQTQTVVHTTVLSWQVMPDSMPGEFLGQLVASVQQRTALPSPDATVIAVQVLLGQITQQASVMAFGDAYRVTFVAAVIAFCLATLLPGKPAREAEGGGGDMVAAH
ncbi:MAG: DHA2 family efflux MFS transporter permease subunit [Chloroflexi bacterium]|nr:DHA2 family efflux MFS transporter permease subunit [Chloroflexota bacterium]